MSVELSISIYLNLSLVAPLLSVFLPRYGTAALHATIRPALTLDPSVDDPSRPWEALFLDLDAGHGLTFSAWRRAGGPGPGGTEYRLAGLQAGATAEAATDFFLDDAHRLAWDTLLVHHALLEAGGHEGEEERPPSAATAHARRQVVVWTRKFRVPLLGPREYVIARRSWTETAGAGGGEEGPTITTVMLGQDTHPAAPGPLTPGAVRVPMWSAWTSRTLHPGQPGHPGAATAEAVSAWVPGGLGVAAAAPAVLTVMVRRESYGLPDLVARPVVARELPLFAGRMGAGWAAYAGKRAARGLGLGEVDPGAYCKKGGGM